MFPAFKIVLFSVVTLGTTAASVQPRPTDVEAIHALVDRMTAAFNVHDAREAAAMYADDADFVSVRGERAHGRKEIEKRLAHIFATRARATTLKTLDTSIRFPKSDVAIVHVTNELSGLVAPDGSRLPPHQELSVRLLLKAKGRWKVAAFHNTIIVPTGPRAR
jgi:uncharacterized protein (TIGR02246 family)